MEIKIDKGVPLPAEFRAINNLYPFRDLEVGCSFFVADKIPRNLSGSRQDAEFRTGFKFVMRATTEKGVKGVRVWRVA